MRIFVLVGIILFVASCAPASEKITVDACKASGGTIVNALGILPYDEYDERYCPENTTKTGLVKGAQCPCICCSPN